MIIFFSLAWDDYGARSFVKSIMGTMNHYHFCALRHGTLSLGS